MDGHDQLGFTGSSLSDSMLVISQDVFIKVFQDIREDDVFHYLTTYGSERDGPVVASSAPVSLFEHQSNYEHDASHQECSPVKEKPDTGV